MREDSRKDYHNAVHQIATANMALSSVGLPASCVNGGNAIRKERRIARFPVPWVNDIQSVI